MSSAPYWAVGKVPTPLGETYQVSTSLGAQDMWGALRSRISAYRMRYDVPPGLYAVGRPATESDVFVSANYKLSFDHLRAGLDGMDAWVLVLDTKSINVWCAAGKGTFGTSELIDRIRGVGLDRVVAHRRVIVPQLGAVGISAHEVRQATGFTVRYGPVLARDIGKYVGAGYKATPAMRTIPFTIADRFILTPMELNPAFKKLPRLALLILLIFGLGPSGILFKDAFIGGGPYLGLSVLSIVSGAFLTPVLLPWVPFRPLAVKGWLMGMLVNYLGVRWLGAGLGQLPVIASYTFFPLLSSYIALQFTGSTTYTGMSGVIKELRYAMPLYIGGAALTALILIVSRLRDWGLI